MNAIMSIMGVPLGYIMWAMYRLVPNYAIAVVLFTIVTKILLLPLAIKQQKGTVKMQLIQPKVAEIQKAYKNNPQRMNEELQALYQRENYSMTAGCLPTLIQFPILFGLIDVIYKPLTHMAHIPASVISELIDLCKTAEISLGTYAPQLDVLKAVQNPANASVFASIDSGLMSTMQSMNLNCFGLDMTATPHFGFHPLVLIPILSGATALLMSVITMKNTPGADAGANATSKSMMYMMPLMSLWFTSMVPVGVGLYWIASNVVACIQTVVLNKFWNPKEIAEKMKAEEAARKEKERQEKIEAKRLAKERGEEVSEKGLSQKELDRQRLAAARKRNAEKYGDYDLSDLKDTD